MHKAARALPGSFATAPWLGLLLIFTLIVAVDEAFRAVFRLNSSAVRRALSDVDSGGPGIIGYV